MYRNAYLLFLPPGLLESYSKTYVDNAEDICPFGYLLLFHVHVHVHYTCTLYAATFRLVSHYTCTLYATTFRLVSVGAN